ncbi:MAG: DNA polymerase III subunit delta [Desulfarculaceae bacterium]|nr:DNA polymerase III subunit delta [Desulfarculaceae bacterium]MCF8073940.1 DNA polymerase III subunit delta [Desulfarculaceae bacterium]MCF8102626.1 DNA polymerase III subunit delta [Desulfarculaceae bacterium]MCF8117605.1 DNA polymerase III subunit delta [Desulfarculaceae bacterium]
MASPGKRQSDPGDLPWPEVAGGTPGPLYGLFGEEDFLVSAGLAAFLASPAFSENPSLNVERFLAAETSVPKALDSARTLPFLGSRRLIILSEVHTYKADQAAEFLPYLEDPTPSTTLVLAGTKLDARTKFAKALKAAGKVHTYQKMYARQLAPWLQGRARLRGKKLAPAAAGYLAELAGLGLGALDSEVEKLSLYVGKAPAIDLATVQELLGGSRLYSIFDFTDAVAARSLARALSSYNQLDSLGEPAVRVLAMLTRLFKQLLETRAVLDQGGDQGQVQRTLRTPPQATETLVRRARAESTASLAKALKRVLAADVALKSSPGADRVIMERLVLDLCA